MTPIQTSGPPTALLMRAGGLACALPIAHVIETFRPLPVVQVAMAPAGVMGMAFFQGDAVPVLHLATLMGDGDEAVTERFVAVRYAGRVVLLAVEGVVGFIALRESDLQALPLLLQGAQPRVVAGLASRDGLLVAVLAAVRLIEGLHQADLSPARARPACAAGEVPKVRGAGRRVA